MNTGGRRSDGHRRGGLGPAPVVAVAPLGSPEDVGPEPPTGSTFSFFARRRIRAASEQVHAAVLERLRAAGRENRQGHAASPGGLAAEVRALAAAQRFAGSQHGPARDAAMKQVRNCYVALAASATILAERSDRPAELRRGEKGGKKGAGSFRPPDFSTPPDLRLVD